MNGFLIEEATRRSGLVWLGLPTGPRPAWHVWQDGAAYVVTGGKEQPLPGLSDLRHVIVTVPSKDNRSRLISWLAACTRVEPSSAEWETVVPVLQAARLNLPDGERSGERWARECTVVRLSPTGQVLDAPGRMPAGSAAAAPPPTPATTVGRLPGMLRRRRRV
ncbi:MAG: hypothetical protein J2P24_09370 [Streptosporangiales bacterium]|nr:hypothetical protein [Streptosporangiales bacterium]MBO0890919.1 hypothetical protein [Acidothermales bacterium]